MIAYNQASLDNSVIQQEAQQALTAGCITAEEYTRIREAHPADFYTPNIFICLGLFMLTIVIASFSLGLLFLLTAFGSGAAAFLLIFSGLLCYGALEFVAYRKKHFRSGVDYALLWMAAGFLYAGLYLAVDNISVISQCVTVFVICLLSTLRFANNIMALIAYAALLAFIFNVSAALGKTAQAVLPFLVMAVSIATYLLCRMLLSSGACRHYQQCLVVGKTAALISFYLAGNYFVVRELSAYMFGSSQQAVGGIALGWLFWILTAATPLLYIYQGVRKKDPIFLWTGLVLIAAALFTIRHYYSVLPIEWAMMLGGIAMVAIAYGLIRYLRTPRHGFTYRETGDKHLLESLHIESLVIAETFAGPSAAPAGNDLQFGGGSGGGGGAGGQY